MAKGKAKHLDFREIVSRSVAIRKRYHALEKKHHGSHWSVEEDALAFLTDAALVGRLAMSQEGRWPTKGDNRADLKHKIGESIWWLIVLAHRMNIDEIEAVESFLSDTERRFE
jgi:hypothetical protein